MAIRKVMLIDDEADIRTIGAMALRSIGKWDVVMAPSGAEGVVLAAAEQPDVILLDVMMPGLDGPATYLKLREQSELVRTPVIFMTAKVQRKEVERYLALGAAGVIHKPFDPLTLPDQVRELAQEKPS